MLDTFEISHIADLKPARISGGQQQRAALARALANRPDILLLDEPFSALDPLMRERMRKQCKELLSRFNTPTIIISHDPADVAVFAQGIVLYENGQAHTRMSADSLESCAADPDSLLGSLADAVRGLRRADGAREQ
jgi:molybdate transport system ATP-binding protein